MANKSYPKEFKQKVLDELSAIKDASDNEKLTGKDFEKVGEANGGITLPTIKKWAKDAGIYTGTKKEEGGGNSNKPKQPALPALENLELATLARKEIDALESEIEKFESELVAKKTELAAKKKEVIKLLK